MYPSGDEWARQNVAVGAIVTMTILGSVLTAGASLRLLTASTVACVGLRIVTRACIVRNMGNEDWTMIAAAVRAHVAFTQPVLTQVPMVDSHIGLRGSTTRLCQGVQVGLQWHVFKHGASCRKLKGTLLSKITPVQM
jgi:hypothetical protein